MYSSQLQKNESGRISVSGELTFDTVPALAVELTEFFAAEKSLTVDLQKIGRADSAGLALLIEWQREAVYRQCQLDFDNVPQQLLALARVSGVDGLLSLQ